MSTALSRSERKYVKELLDWDTGRRRLDSVLCHVALVVGGGLIAGAAIMTAGRLDDRAAIGLFLPACVSGLFLVGVYHFGHRRIRERRRLAEILRKLQDDSH